MALSADPAAEARRTKERLDLPYSLCHDLDTRQTAERIGCYISEDPLHLQPTGFLLTPDSRIALVVYSSGPIGRLVARDTVEELEHLQGG